VLAATNQKLAELVRAKRFREDLYFRLNVVTLELPPLRERHSDIPLLVEHFVNKHRYGRGAAPARISQEAMSRLMTHDWPGNVRELENTIERAVIMARGGVIAADHITFPGQDTRRTVLDVAQALSDGMSLSTFLREAETRYVREALRQAGGNIGVAAGLMGTDAAEAQRRVDESLDA
jgi:DNA-binding NtrC family response regulator